MKIYIVNVTAPETDKGYRTFGFTSRVKAEEFRKKKKGRTVMPVTLNDWSEID